MAFIFSTQTLVETKKRLVIKLVGQTTGVDDTGNLAVNTLALSGFKGLAGNVGLLNVKTIHHSITANASVRLYWYGASGNSNIAVLAGSGTFPQPGSDGFVIAPDAANATGNIWVATSGFSSAQAGYTLILDIKKDPTYFDPGTANDPAAFNR